ncbi:MAG: DUF7341 domain-containing protein, partial [Candidatus Eiseniibacteriota bacterium]
MTSTLHHRDEHEDQVAPVDPVMTRLAFDAAVDQLTVPGSATITRDDGSTEAAATACLLDQLVEATQPGGERSGSSNPGSRPPASMNALAVVAEIGTEMRDALAALGYNVFGPRLRRARLSTQVRQWASHAEQWQHHDVTYLAYCAAQAARWVEQARA